MLACLTGVGRKLSLSPARINPIARIPREKAIFLVFMVLSTCPVNRVSHHRWWGAIVGVVKTVIIPRM